MSGEQIKLRILDGEAPPAGFINDIEKLSNMNAEQVSEIIKQLIEALFGESSLEEMVKTLEDKFGKSENLIGSIRCLTYLFLMTARYGKDVLALEEDLKQLSLPDPIIKVIVESWKSNEKRIIDSLKSNLFDLGIPRFVSMKWRIDMPIASDTYYKPGDKEIIVDFIVKDSNDGKRLNYIFKLTREDILKIVEEFKRILDLY